MRIPVTFVGLTVAMLAGGGEYQPAKSKAKPAAEADSRPAKSPATPSGEAAAPPLAAPGEEGRDKGEKPAATREKAAVGVGEKGRGYGLGPVAVPIAALFSTKNERVPFDIQIPKTMQLYKAEKGHAPKTHDEFMNEIIKKGQISLPQLPPGHKYVYDPEQEQLMVETPAK
jgi:hypothetical protein